MDTAAIAAIAGALGYDELEIKRLSALAGLHAMAHEVRKYMASGMEAFVSKPIRIQDLYAAMQQVLLADLAREVG